MRKTGQVDPTTGLIILFALIVWGVHSIAYDSGYDQGFSEANKTYTSCLEKLDSDIQFYSGLLEEKEKDMAYWKGEYLECQKKDPRIIMFPVLVFNEITYNILIMGIWISLGLNLFSGKIRISFGREVDEFIRKNYDIFLFVKFMAWGIVTLFVLWPIINFLNNFF